ncbi:MAG: methylenetetrahydrofolate reductase C-terminal domain-containing protein [Xanthobacteraceae bacterium]
MRHARGLKRLYDAFSHCAPYFSPMMRLLGAARTERLLTPVERAAKGFLFDCKMCGQCVLSSTGMACPMNCAKQMRNGPCGGVRPDGNCEVVPTMPCVWVEATEGLHHIAAGRESSTSGAAPHAPAPASQHAARWLLGPVDHRQHQRSSWVKLIDGALPPPIFELPPPRAGTVGAFEKACRSGQFVVTVEVAPPDSADPAALVERAMRFKGLVDAINITDGAGGNCHMSSVAASAVLVQNGITPVWQLTCRDRNRIAIQGEFLGAAALGIRNVLCLTGDDVSQGDHPQAKPVFDLDAVSLLRVARNMRDRGIFLSGRKLEVPPDLFLGASLNPFVPPHRDRVANLEMKVDAGAQFVQTQFCFDLDLFERFMRQVRERELHKRCFIIVGVGILSTAKALRWMAEHVPGVHIPEPVLTRIGKADDQKAEGKLVLVETIHRLAEIEGVAGVHLMGHKNERVLSEAIVEAGLRAPREAQSRYA